MSTSVIKPELNATCKVYNVGVKTIQNQYVADARSAFTLERPAICIVQAHVNYS